MTEHEFEKDVRNMKSKEILKRLYPYLRPYLFSFIVAIILSIVAVGISLVEPIILEFTINSLADGNFVFNELALYIIIYAVLIVVSFLIVYISSIVIQKIGQKIIMDIREDLFTHLVGLSTDFHSNNQVGRLVNRTTSDINSLSQMFTNVMINVIKSLIQVVLIFGIMLYKSPKITMVVVIFMPIVFIGSMIFGKLARSAYRKVRERSSILTGFLAESFSGMKIIQTFNQEEEKKIQFKEKNDDLLKYHLRQLFLYSVYRPSVHFIYMMSVVAVYLVGGNDVINGALSIGTLFLMGQYITRFFQPIQLLSDQYDLIQASFSASERVFGLLDTKKTVEEKPDGIVVDKLVGEIEFKNVWFAYQGDDWILRDLSFKVEALTSCAFVGATGAGKTTILALITRNYDVNKGEVLIDGINVKDYDLNSLRRCIGQMLQDVFMFSGTIKTNISLNDETISLEDIKEACKYVNADGFISRLENQYDEEVRERGNNFSTGQRQLISFARTMVSKPNIMILDEATSNIDTETEQLIQDSLSKMMSVGTMLIVAHRLSTIQNADKIIVLSKGQLIESGNHQELLKLKGHYYKLYQLQFEKKAN